MLKTTMVGAALSLSLVPLAARADEPCRTEGQYQQPQAYEPQYEQPYQGIQVGEPNPSGGGYEARPDFRRRGGRYELRTVQRWVEGRSTQVYVPEQCSSREGHFGWYRRAAAYCVPAHYEQRWVPGHSETVQQWVWVPFAIGRHFGNR